MKKNKTVTKTSLLQSFERTYRICLVSDEADTQPIEAALTQKELFSLLSKHNIVDEKSTTAFIPGTFTHTNTRDEADMREISLIVYDIDGKKNHYTLENLKQKLSHYSCIIYSTYNSSYEHPRWRIVLLLDKPIPPEYFKNVHHKISNELNIEIDQACTNINRLYYLPSTSKFNDFTYSWTNSGILINYVDFLKDISKPQTLAKAQKRTTHSRKTEVNRGYVSFGSVGGLERDLELCGFVVPEPLKAPFSQEDFDELLSQPGTWLRAAKYLGFPIERITHEKPYSRSFSSVIPGVEDNIPSCSIALYSENGKYRVVYQAFNEVHFVSGASGPVKFDLSHIYAMMHSGRRIPKEEFPAGTNKVWLTRLLIDAGMIIPEEVCDLPDLPEEAVQAERLYTGFRRLLQCKRVFKEQIADATAFTLTFACYWCRIGNRNTAKKYTQILLDNGVLRFVDRINLPRGGSVPLIMPAGKSAKVYQLCQRESKAKRGYKNTVKPAQYPIVELAPVVSMYSYKSTAVVSSKPIKVEPIPILQTTAVNRRIFEGGNNDTDVVMRIINVIRQNGMLALSLEVLLAEVELPVDDELIAFLPFVKRYISDYDEKYPKLSYK
ncbi:hypothetical protein [Photorhabdus bodei]|uniref:Primase C-terminal 1 domain-containing protein n=1 Tax=Photorhabdus bodei TaxID=2029681 RepID=A0AAW6BMI0_9GAMM|nr:hypothetical protein [Photorhabdus bodei]MDB6373966.1 hypothetical protein [Photorhabdus bodei]